MSILRFSNSYDDEAINVELKHSRIRDYVNQKPGKELYPAVGAPGHIILRAVRNWDKFKAKLCWDEFDGFPKTDKEKKSSGLKERGRLVGHECGSGGGDQNKAWQQAAYMMVGEATAGTRISLAQLDEWSYYSLRWQTLEGSGGKDQELCLTNARRLLIQQKGSLESDFWNQGKRHSASEGACSSWWLERGTPQSHNCYRKEKRIWI